jgi:hypothetical protein
MLAAVAAWQRRPAPPVAPVGPALRPGRQRACLPPQLPRLAAVARSSHRPLPGCPWAPSPPVRSRSRSESGFGAPAPKTVRPTSRLSPSLISRRALADRAGPRSVRRGLRSRHVPSLRLVRRLQRPVRVLRLTDPLLGPASPRGRLARQDEWQMSTCGSFAMSGPVENPSDSQRLAGP